MDSDRKISDSLEITDPQVIKAFVEKPNNTFLVSFPRTGSHWLRMLMELYFRRPSLIRVFYYPERTDYLTLHTHDIDLDVMRSDVIYLYRDPVDTIYSQLRYYHESLDDLDRLEFWAELYGRHLDKWLYRERFCRHKTVVTYEGMKRDIASEFSKVTNHFGQRLDKELLETAVSRVSKEEVERKTRHDPQVIKLDAAYKTERSQFRLSYEQLIWEIVKKGRPYLKAYFENCDTLGKNCERQSSALLSDKFGSTQANGISPDAAQKPSITGSADQYKIVGLIGARNEEHFIDQCLRALSIFTDAIVFIDDASDDSTLRIVESLSQECRIQKIIRKAEWHRDEPGDRNRLLQAGREIGGTHFIVVDADEMLTANLADNNILRDIMLSLSPGEQLQLTWIQLWRSVDNYRYDNSIWTNNLKEVVFHDDGRCYYESDFIHTPRVPQNLSGTIRKLEGYTYGLMHFQFVNWRDLLIKQAWYRCIERIRHPEKQAEMINDLYAHSKDETNLRLRLSSPEWFAGYPFFDKTVFKRKENWQEKQILSWFSEYGLQFFADLDIWDIDWGPHLADEIAGIKRRLASDLRYSVSFGEGFYRSEGAWRWINKRGHMSIAKAALMKPVMISFDLMCGPAEYYGHFPFEMRIFKDGELAESFSFTNSEKPKKISLGIEKSNSDIHIRIECGASFVPAQLGINQDSRELSVQMSNLTLESE
jgi:glycosyltransferase involved in cell wall biosynthesis